MARKSVLLIKTSEDTKIVVNVPQESDGSILVSVFPFFPRISDQFQCYITVMIDNSNHKDYWYWVNNAWEKAKTELVHDPKFEHLCLKIYPHPADHARLVIFIGNYEIDDKIISRDYLDPNGTPTCWIKEALEIEPADHARLVIFIGNYEIDDKIVSRDYLDPNGTRTCLIKEVLEIEPELVPMIMHPCIHTNPDLEEYGKNGEVVCTVPSKNENKHSMNNKTAKKSQNELKKTLKLDKELVAKFEDVSLVPVPPVSDKEVVYKTLTIAKFDNISLVPVPLVSDKEVIYKTLTNEKRVSETKIKDAEEDEDANFNDETKKEVVVVKKSRKKMTKCYRTSCIKSGKHHCSSCKSVIFCSQECSDHHWPTHREECRLIREARKVEED